MGDRAGEWWSEAKPNDVACGCNASNKQGGGMTRHPLGLHHASVGQVLFVHRAGGVNRRNFPNLAIG